MIGSALVLSVLLGALHARAQDPPAEEDSTADFRGVERARWRVDRERLRVEMLVRVKAGQWDEAVALGKQQVARSREIMGEFDDETFTALNRLAAFYAGREDWASARKTLEEVIALRERQPARKEWKVRDARLTLAECDRRAAMTPSQRARLKEAFRLSHLGNMQRFAQRDYDAALKTELEVERIRREILGEDHIEYGHSLFALATIYEHKSDFARAETLRRKHSEIARRVKGESHPEYGSTLRALAGMYDKMGDRARAEPLFRQAVAIDADAFGYADVRCWRALMEAGNFYLEKGDKTHAEPIIRQLHAVVISMYNEGNYDINPAELAVKLSRQVDGEDGPGHAESLGRLARMQMARADYARAEPLFRQAVEIMKRARGESHPDYARALNDLTELYRIRGDYARAEPLLRRVVEIVKQAQGESQPEYARALGGLAAMYQAKGDYAAAEPLLRRALEIVAAASGASGPDHARALNDLANLYRDKGDDARALALYRQTLAIALKIQSRGSAPLAPAYARGLRDLAELYRDRGDYARAEPLLRLVVGRQMRPVVAHQTTRYDADHTAGLDTLASLYLDMGDHARAEAPLGWALEMRRQGLGESHPDYARSLSALARVYAALGDFAHSEPMLREALAIQKRSRGESHPEYAGALGALADVYAARGDGARAEPLLRQAVEIRRKAQGESHPDYARSLGALARVYAARGDGARAETLFRQSLEVLKRSRGESHPDYAAGLGDLAEVYASRGDGARAEPLLGEALDRTSAWLRDTSAVLGERQRLRLYARSRHFLDRFLSVALQVGLGPADLYARVLEWKGAVDAGLAEERLAQDEPELSLRLDELAHLKASLARFAIVPGDNRLRLEDLSVRKEGLEADLAARSAAFRRSRQELALGQAEITTSLSGDEALVDLFEYSHFSPPDGGKGPLRQERRLLAFLLRPGVPVALVPLGPAQPVTEAVRSWRGALVAGQAAGVQAASAALGRHVWAPIRPHLDGARTVLIGADGALVSFPFAALPGRRPDTYLIEDLALGYVASGRQLVQTRAARPGSTGRGLLAVGGVDFQADPGRTQPSDRPQPAAPAPPPLLVQRGGFAPLPGSLPEAESVHALFRAAFPDQPADLLVGVTPNEGELKRRLDGGRMRVAHLATHGFFESPARVAALRAEAQQLERAPMRLPSGPKAEDTVASALAPLLRSGVVLAGGSAVKPVNLVEDLGPRPNEDGILTAEEVQALDLRGTELVVLSGCETGLGDLEFGQGVLGLQRAFQAAGARAVVASLWKVDDAATAVLMERFYTNLWTKKLPKLEALRQAQLDVLKDRSLVDARRVQMVSRGIASAAERLPGGGRADQPKAGVAQRGDPALWAAFLLSGDGRSFQEGGR
jgi:CHAT domain-containing protein/Tfp pilus assembly protein PilF